jgi:hypothetical protein
LKKRLTLIFLTLTIIIFGGFFAFKVHPQSEYSAATGFLLDRSSDLTTSLLTDQLTTIRTSLQSAADKIGRSNTLCQNINSDFKKLGSKVDGVFEIDSADLVQCSTDQSLVGLNAERFDSFQNFLRDPNHYPTVSRVFSIQDHPNIIAGYVPILDQNQKYLGAVGVFTSTANLGTRLPHPSSLANAGYVVLFDDNGDVLYHFDRTLVGHNRFSKDMQDYTGHNEALNQAFTDAAAGKITKNKIPYTVRGQNRVGEFRSIPVGTKHNLILLTSLPNN